MYVGVKNFRHKSQIFNLKYLLSEFHEPNLMLKYLHCLCLVGMGEQLADINNEVYIVIFF